MRPKLLDLFRCEGGASEGYYRAGFDVYGIDLFKHVKMDTAGNPVLDKRGKPVRVGFSQGRSPYLSRQMDAIEALDRLLSGDRIRFNYGRMRDDRAMFRGLSLDDFDAIHASPPCQHASAGTRAMRSQGKSEHPALIEPTRERLEQTGLPWVIENVSGAALRDPITLCGSMFDLIARDEDGLPLRLERHRLFESNVTLTAPCPCRHDPDFYPAGVYGGSRRAKKIRPDETLAELAPRDRHAARHDRKGGYVPRSERVQQQLLGIDWMTKGGMAQSIPPAYAKWVGHELLDHIPAKEAA